MKYRLLGRTGIYVSELCLGTMTFGHGWGLGGIDQAGANRIVAESLEAGINFIDTADMYSDGDSEILLGRALGELGRRDSVVLATKAFARMGTGPNDAGLSRYHLVRACEGSLKRLGTDRIDLYQIHAFDEFTPIEEVLETLDLLVRSGKVLHVGCCNWAAWQIALALGRSASASRFVSAQMYYSLVGRDVEHEVVPLCRRENLALLPWSPLSGGFLTGKYRREQTGLPEGSRFATSKFGEFPPVDKEVGFRVVDRLLELSAERAVAPATVALKWLLSKPAVTSVIIGVRRLEQLADNLAAVSLELPDDRFASLDAISEPPALYPNWMIKRQARNRVV